MARKHKVGIDYFSHDVDMCQDNKMRIIMAKHGLNGYGVFNRLLEELYRDQGYYLQVNEDFNILFANDNNIEIDVYINILNDCINKELFDIKMYNKYKILTSKRIQTNYIEATKRRKKVDFTKEYLLLSRNEINDNYGDVIDVNINKIDDNINSVDDDISTQRKGKESKEKEIKENNIENDFEYLWEMYPSKKGKGNITKSKKKLNFISDNKEELERCINRYEKYVTNERKNGFESLRYMNGSTFFNSGYVDYLDKNYTEEVEVETDKQNLKRGYDSKQETAEYLGYETVEEMEQALKNKNETEEEINF